jgi:hypothetical protein
VFLGDCARIEELAHQCVIALGHQLNQSLVCGLGLFGHIGGNLLNLGLAVAAHLVDVGLHSDQVHHALETLFRTDRKLHRNHRAPEGGGQRLHYAIEVGAFAVHARANDNARQFEFIGIVPDLLRNYLDARDGVHDDESGIHGGDDHLGLVHEHVEAGSVNEVNLGFVPLHRGQRSRDRHLAGNFLLVIVGHGAAVIHPAQPGRAAGGVEKSGNKRGFAGMGVADYRHVAYILTIVGLH